MKRILYTLAAIIASISFTSCGDDDWNYDKSQENVYFFGPEVWGYDDIKKGNNNVVHYEVEQGQTVAVPMQFWCEFIRSYDVVTYYYVAPKPQDQKYYASTSSSEELSYDGPDLVCGVDYEVVDKNGTKLTPNANGAYEFTWKNAQKGVQNIYIKALNGKKGAFNIMTSDPNGVTPTNSDVESTIQHSTDKYTVRVFSQNYRVTVNIL